MVTPTVFFAGKFSAIAAESASESLLRSITIVGLDDSEAVAVRPVFEGFNWNDMTQNQPNTPGYRTHNVGLYPPGRIDSGLNEGFKREFEEAIVIVQPINQAAMALPLFGRISVEMTNDEIRSGVLVPTVKVNFYYQSTAAVGSADKVYQYVVIKRTSNLYAS